MRNTKAARKKEENDDDLVVDDTEGCCAHGVREDRDCMACHAEGCPGGGSCGCPGNVPRSKRHLYDNIY